MATLKISDLSVGDWVRCGQWNGRIQRIAMHDGETVEVCIEVDYGRLYMYKRVCEIDSIPITPEILEANGWRNDGMYAILRIDEHLHLEYYYHEHRLRKWYCGVDEWENHAKVNDITFQAHCYSIHQLQHALRLAGVNKEIIMPNK